MPGEGLLAMEHLEQGMTESTSQEESAHRAADDPGHTQGETLPEAEEGRASHDHGCGRYGPGHDLSSLHQEKGHKRQRAEAFYELLDGAGEEKMSRAPSSMEFSAPRFVKRSTHPSTKASCVATEATTDADALMRLVLNIFLIPKVVLLTLLSAVLAGREQ
jgi:hypothetical protein